MTPEEAAIEQELQDKGKTGPRVTPDALDQVIAHEDYHHFPGSTVIVCVLTLRNGYAVLGSSACVYPDNFDAEIGRKIARADAREKIRPLEAYLLRQHLAEQAGII